MKVLMIAPGFPREMAFFTRGLARVGASVYGLADGPPQGLPPEAGSALTDYLRVTSLWDEDAVVEQAVPWAERAGIERVECLWEPAMLLAARLRERLGIPGMSVEHTMRFRDKELMKRALDDAGLRTPRHVRASGDRAIREAAERIGFPLIVKPIAGAGSADTHRVESSAELDTVLPTIRHVAEVSVEEYVEGEEYTFDTVCAGGEVQFFNMAWYRPKPLIARTVEWMSPQTVTLRDVDASELAVGRDLGRAVLRALEFDTGFTHMEWFRTPSGEAVFGEIGARPPGARSVDLMNYACDIDLFTGWAEAVCHGKLSQTVERKYNAAIIFKRARGEGRIRRIVGLEHLMAHIGRHVRCVELLPVGAHRRDWKQTLLSDGYLIVRHPDLDRTLELADRVGTDVELYAE